MEIQITPLYELLIYLEDKKSIAPKDLEKWGKNVSRGILGKMEAMDLIVKENVTGEVKITLSKKGYLFLNSILDALHKSIVHWDSKWRIVWFSIPESRRPIRDKFRRTLESIGMRPVLGSLWISPLSVGGEVISCARKFGIYEKVIYIETDHVEGLSQSQILSAWDFDKYKQYYEGFIEKADQFLSSKQEVDSRMYLKKLIFEYALILNNEPNLPIELFPNDWPKFRAQLMYKKIRRRLS